MVISSLVVEALPDKVEDVEDALVTKPGVEVHERNGYKLVVTIEADTVDDSHDIASSFITIPGVIGVDLIYFNFEDDKTIYPEGV
jgi:nitrate reductase NapD